MPIQCWNLNSESKIASSWKTTRKISCFSNLSKEKQFSLKIEKMLVLVSTRAKFVVAQRHQSCAREEKWQVTMIAEAFIFLLARLFLS